MSYQNQPAAFIIRLLGIILLSVVSMVTQAAAEFTFEGEAMDARYQDRSTIKLSLLNWPQQQFQQEVVSRFKEMQQSGDAEGFSEYLYEQETLGYVFTGAAVGYAVKYAWQDSSTDNERMVFLIAPGLKTRNKSLWVTPNTEEPYFTLLEVRKHGANYLLKASLGSAIDAKDTSLSLRDFDALPAIANLQVVRPYYWENI